jgi:hypothetical protein
MMLSHLPAAFEVRSIKAATFRRKAIFQKAHRDLNLMDTLLDH